MLRELTYDQFIELRAFEELEPFVAQRASLLTKMHLTGSSNFLMMVHRVKNRFKLSDFTLPWEQTFGATASKPVEKTWQQLKAIARALCEGYSGNK